MGEDEDQEDTDGEVVIPSEGSEDQPQLVSYTASAACANAA